MRTATIRDLRYRFKALEVLLREGEEVEVTRHGRVIAKLVPAGVRAPAKLPDFMGRMKSIFGNKRLTVSAAELLAQVRD